MFSAGIREKGTCAWCGAMHRTINPLSPEPAAMTEAGVYLCKLNITLKVAFCPFLNDNINTGFGFYLHALQKNIENKTRFRDSSFSIFL
jgi:hypothetical protein